MSPRRFDCVLFDLDNTLIEIPDPWNYFDGIIIEVVRDDFHLPVPTQEQRDTLWRTGKEYYKILASWGIPDAKKFWDYFDNRDYTKRKVMITEKKLIIHPEILPILHQLKVQGYTLGIVTNSPTFIARMELDAYNFDSIFSIVLGLGETQDICKPEPDGILMVLKKLGFLPEKAVYIGDSTVDLIAAKRAHVKGLLLDRTRKKHIDHAELMESDFVRVGSFEELLSFLS